MRRPRGSRPSSSRLVARLLPLGRAPSARAPTRPTVLRTGVPAGALPGQRRFDEPSPSSTMPRSRSPASAGNPASQTRSRSAPTIRRRAGSWVRGPVGARSEATGVEGDPGEEGLLDPRRAEKVEAVLREPAGHDRCPTPTGVSPGAKSSIGLMVLRFRMTRIEPTAGEDPRGALDGLREGSGRTAVPVSPPRGVSQRELLGERAVIDDRDPDRGRVGGEVPRAERDAGGDDEAQVPMRLDRRAGLDGRPRDAPGAAWSTGGPRSRRGGGRCRRGAR